MRRRGTVLIVALAIALPMLAVSGAGRAAPADQIHYPDLRTRPPAELTIRWESGKKVLRFSNTIYNFGAGPLELRPENQRGGGTTAYQRLYAHDASGKPYLVQEIPVGTFVFHRAHHHWHFEGFALYELLFDAGGSFGSLATSSYKTTVCIRDNRNPEPGGSDLEHFGWGGYTRCTKTSTEGLSVGYGDTYTWDIAGQDINITGLADGCYWLHSTADPGGLLAESNDGNNANAVQFSITGNDIGTC